MAISHSFKNMTGILLIYAVHKSVNHVMICIGLIGRSLYTGGMELWLPAGCQPFPPSSTIDYKAAAWLHHGLVIVSTATCSMPIDRVMGQQHGPHLIPEHLCLQARPVA
jgi:hypothetical protein